MFARRAPEAAQGTVPDVVVEAPVVGAGFVVELGSVVVVVLAFGATTSISAGFHWPYLASTVTLVRRIDRSTSPLISFWTSVSLCGGWVSNSVLDD